MTGLNQAKYRQGNKSGLSEKYEGYTTTVNDAAIDLQEFTKNKIC